MRKPRLVQLLVGLVGIAAIFILTSGRAQACAKKLAQSGRRSQQTHSRKHPPTDHPHPEIQARQAKEQELDRLQQSQGQALLAFFPFYGRSIAATHRSGGLPFVYEGHAEDALEKIRKAILEELQFRILQADQLPIIEPGFYTELAVFGSNPEVTLNRVNQAYELVLLQWMLARSLLLFHIELCGAQLETHYQHSIQHNTPRNRTYRRAIRSVPFCRKKNMADQEAFGCVVRPLVRLFNVEQIAKSHILPRIHREFLDKYIKHLEFYKLHPPKEFAFYIMLLQGLPEMASYRN